MSNINDYIKIALMGILLFLATTASAQSSSSYSKLAKKSYEKKNYVDASLHAIDALRIKAKNKKAQEILSLAFAPAIISLEHTISKLENESENFIGDITVEKRTQIFKKYIQLRKLDRGAIEIIRTVDSKKFKLEFSKINYKDGMVASKDLLQQAKEQAAEMHYVESKELMKLNDRASSKKAAKKLKKAYMYVPDYKDAKALYQKAKVNGSTHLLILSLDNISGTSNFGNIETVIPKLLTERIKLDPDLMEFVVLENATSVKSRAVMNGVALGNFSLEWLQENAKNIGVDAIFMGEVTSVFEKKYPKVDYDPVRKKKNVDSGKDRKYQDSKGKWQTESIWVDVYANVYQHKRQADVSTSINIKYVDFEYNKREYGSFSEVYKWKNEWITYTGDERAAKTHYLAKKSEIYYPSHDFFANELGVELSKKILNKIEYLLK